MSVVTSTVPEEKRQRVELSELFRRYGTACIFIVLVLGATYESPAFLTERNVMNVLRQVAPTGIMAVGMLFVILTGGIDLSVGSVMGLASAAIGLSLGSGQGPAILAGIAVGLAAGCVNGGLVAALGIDPLISSLALLVAARGLAQAMLGGSRLDLPGSGALAVMGRYAVGGIPLVAIGAAVVAVLVAGLVRGTIFGRYAVFVGASRTAAFLAGVPVRRTLLLVYALGGALAGAAGVLASARLGAADPNYIGVGLELDAIAAVVIGGTPLSGGRITILGSVFGVLLLRVLDASFIMNDINATYAQMLKAVFIVAALYLQRTGG